MDDTLKLPLWQGGAGLYNVSSTSLFLMGHTMHKTLLSVWPLFFGVAMLMLGNGLQNTLLGVRATMEGFNPIATGTIMSMFYTGFLFGSHLVPRLIQRVGHIRVFSALSALAAITALLHGLFMDEAAWMIIRAVTGFSFAGLYIVIESWLNHAADNKTRGTMMAAYLVVLYGAMAAGQYTLTLYDPEGMELFALVSIFIGLALVPVSLSSRPAPKFERPVKVSIKELFKTSPLGVYGVFAAGMGGACLFSIAPVYAAQAGFGLAQISTFMAITIVGGVMLQFPIGRCSDLYGRRRVLIIVSAFTTLFCAAAIFAAAMSVYALYLAMFMIGGTALTVYGLSTAHTNDHLAPAQIVAASASMLMVNGVGAIIGPLLSTALMNFAAPWMLFAVLSGVYGSITVFGIYRATRRAPVPLTRQDKFVVQPSPSSTMVMQKFREETEDNRLIKNTNS